ncbi:MAG: hypothetical protein LBS46_02875 [Dysgonamonadaceae bacterium]|jgi:hypothetical protein|nr:hypothetical protein [Dysgonamonadaceae bacterium]
MAYLQKKNTEALPQKSVTLSGMSGAGVAPVGKHEPKLPYVAPSFTTIGVDIEPFCGQASIRMSSYYPVIEDEIYEDPIYDIEIFGL